MALAFAPAEPTPFDASIQPRRGWMLVDLRRRDKEIAVLGGIIESVNSIPRTTKGIAMKFGEPALARDGAELPAGFGEGSLVEFIPHGGTMLIVPPGHPDRMVVPVGMVLGIWAA